jgi:hypothetical protein
MNIALPALAVVFAAFCVWLGVRVYNRREQWAKWMLAALVGLPVLYVMSFWLAIFLLRNKVIPLKPTAIVYKPIVDLIRAGPDWVLSCMALDDPFNQVQIMKMHFVLSPDDPLRGL